jgi:serine/threonine protein kinase
LYAAPERVNQRTLEDFRSDCFSLAIVAYELLTSEKPFDGLGGRAGLIENVESNPLELALPSANATVRNRITKRAAKLLDGLFASSLALIPDQRYATRSDWLSAWDQLYREVGKGSRLSPWQGKMVNGIEWIKSSFLGSRK